MRLALNSLICVFALLVFAAPVKATIEGPSATLALPPVTAAPSLEDDNGWDAAVSANVGWDFTNGRTAREATRVRLVIDGRNLYARFDVTQHDPIVATQRVDDNGDGSDDEVILYVWPSGSNGNRYEFAATPNGTHYQYSTENANFAPTWTSRARTRVDGYSVTMVVPLASLRSDGRDAWLAQFARITQRRGETDEWTHGAGQSSVRSSIYAGTVTGFRTLRRATRPQPRLGVYGLGELATASAGGSTSRVGADLSLPITPTSSFVATIHPDFSNVETDQQTISPTTFQRNFNEVRPFFSQSASNIYIGNCSGCPNILELYTPAIPTPRNGYAVEGTQGPFKFGAFDAVGAGRSDTAETVSYATPNRRFNAFETRVTADRPGFHDVTSLVTVAYNTEHNYNAYFDYGNDRGTNVLDVSRAARYDGGAAYYTKDDYDSFTMRKLGKYYNPADGLISLTDISGYSAQASHTFQFGPTARYQSLSANAFVDHYAATTGGTNLADFSLGATLVTRTKFSASFGAGSSYVRLPGDILRPANQQGVSLYYQANTALQDTLLYNFGRFGDGRLVSINRDAAFKVARRATVSINADETNWHGDDGTRAVQWLERASLSFDLGPRSSLTFGARKIVGTAPPFGAIPAAINVSNLSFGYTLRRPHDDLFFVYGDASQLVTRHALTLKIVHYFGAEKGT